MLKSIALGLLSSAILFSAAQVEAQQLPASMQPDAKMATVATQDATAQQEAYGNILNRHISRYNEYPEEAWDKGVEGTAIIFLRINRAGKVLTAEVAQSSGSKLLDDAALATIRKGEPFPPMPDYAFEGMETAEFTVPLLYVK